MEWRQLRKLSIPLKTSVLEVGKWNGVTQVILEMRKNEMRHMACNKQSLDENSGCCCYKVIPFIFVLSPIFRFCVKEQTNLC